MSGRRALTDFRAPGEAGAEERAWNVARAAYAERSPRTRHTALRPRVITVALAMALAAAAALSPAGATVSRLLTRALGVHHARPALFSLPAPGRLLVSGPGATWTVEADGSSRRLGAWGQADWSPHGRYVAVSSRNSLTAVNRLGDPQWSLARPDLGGARWFAPTGYRLAYISRRELRVVAGDGTGDHLLASDVARVAPAWRPGHPYQLAYLTARGKLVVRDADTGARLWTAPQRERVHALVWSPDGRRLVVRAARAVLVYTALGRLEAVQPAPRGSVILDSALAPDGKRLVLIVSSGAENEALVERLGASGPAPRRLLTGEGLGQAIWSPNGRWVLVTWPAADQWVFIRALGAPRIVAVSRIRQQFAGRGATAFPQVSGWCCSAAGTGG